MKEVKGVHKQMRICLISSAPFSSPLLPDILFITALFMPPPHEHSVVPNGLNPEREVSHITLLPY
jgi:hypothetical protein